MGNTASLARQVHTLLQDTVHRRVSVARTTRTLAVPRCVSHLREAARRDRSTIARHSLAHLCQRDTTTRGQVSVCTLCVQEALTRRVQHLAALVVTTAHMLQRDHRVAHLALEVLMAMDGATATCADPDTTHLGVQAAAAAALRDRTHQ